MLVGGWRALRQHDIKLLLAYGTVSQLGFIVAIAGLGTKASALSALALVIAHALFKSTLFLTVGVVDKCTGTRDLRQLSGVGRRLLARVGAGDARRRLDGRHRAARRLRVQGERASSRCGRTSRPPRPLPAPWSWLAITASWPGRRSRSPTRRASSGAPSRRSRACPPTPVKAAHPGFVLAPRAARRGQPAARPARPSRVAVAAAVCRVVPRRRPSRSRSRCGTASPCRCCSRSCRSASGLALFAGRDLVARVQSGVPPLVDGERGFARTLRWVDRGAVETTAVTQRGSLPIYLAGILIVFVALPGVAAVTPRDAPAGPALGQPRSGRRRGRRRRGSRPRARHASSAHRGHARRRHRLRRLPALHPPRGSRPRDHPDARRDGVARRLRPRAAPPADEVHAPPALARRAPGASRSGWPSARPSARSRSSRRGAAAPSPCRPGSPRRPTRSATGRTSSTSRSSTSARGTPSARCRCSWPPRPASPA